jgi:ribonuclease P protein component
VIGCIVRSSDFERVLRMRSRVSSAHFALHHLPTSPHIGRRLQPASVPQQLSTGESVSIITPVDDLPPTGLWLGAVIPKRHARRAVTRNLIKRQIRAAVARHVDSLAAGLWVVRLRGPFDRTRFTSAASAALKLATRAELEQVLTAAHLRALPA